MDRNATLRHKMVEEQLRRRGVVDPRVLAAIETVPRERFVPPEAAKHAYEDRAMPIAAGQTISQPYIVGLMTQALELHGTEKVLEIGTGSGYQAAILSKLARRVFSMERHAELALAAGLRLAEFGADNVTVITGDGTLGWPDAAPYDRIIVTAGGAAVPPALFEQLAEGGLLVMPVGGYDEQTLEVVRKLSGCQVTETLCPVRFVHLIGEQGWSE